MNRRGLLPALRWLCPKAGGLEATRDIRQAFLQDAAPKRCRTENYFDAQASGAQRHSGMPGGVTYTTSRGIL